MSGGLRVGALWAWVQLEWGELGLFAGVVANLIADFLDG